MKINSSFAKPSFKGYDALPLKSIYLEESYCELFIDEMKAIAEQKRKIVKMVCSNFSYDGSNIVI